MSDRAVTSSALSNLGADLSVSISFSVANEFIGAAREAQMGDDELVAVLVTVVVVVTSIKRLVDKASRWIASSAGKRDDGDAVDDAAVASEEQQRGLLEFVSLMLSIAQRITLSISVQVLAYSVKTNQPSRLVRVTTLLGVVVFFVFFESAATRR
jgi:hypothetical protein